MTFAPHHLVFCMTSFVLLMQGTTVAGSTISDTVKELTFMRHVQCTKAAGRKAGCMEGGAIRVQVGLGMKVPTGETTDRTGI